MGERESEREREREMRRRKAVRSADPETLICKREEEEEEKLGAKEGKGFFACYLLTSLSPRHKGQTYIGFTVNPRRRIRQHNGEIMCGACRTKKKRPWEMVLCVYGFPTNVSALQFEWAWQHPRESLAVRQAAASFKSLSGIANKIKLAYSMLTLPTWQSLNLTVNFFSTKYVKHSSGCPSLPEHMKVQLRSMDELPCYIEGESCLYDNSEDEQECNQGGRADGLLMEDLLNITANDIEDCDESIELPSLQRYGWIEEENEMSQSCESPASKEDHRHPSQLADSPVRKLVLPASSSSAEQTDTDQGSIENNRAMRNELPAKTDDKGAVYTEETAEGGDVFGLFCESSFVLGRANRKSPARTDDNKDPPTTSFTASREIEVIDVLTPSPDCRISLCNKKRRVRTVCPEIIDLTKSPLFAQL